MPLVMILLVLVIQHLVEHVLVIVDMKTLLKVQDVVKLMLVLIIHVVLMLLVLMLLVEHMQHPVELVLVIMDMKTSLKVQDAVKSMLV